MSSSDEDYKNNSNKSNNSKNINTELKCPKSPKQQIQKVAKKPSFICLMQVDDDSGSGSSQREPSSTSKKLSKSNEEQNISSEDPNVSNDRYEDSFDEEYGDECDTKPASGNTKDIKSEKKDMEKLDEL